MATYYLRPSADISLEHSCSTGSSGYALINEATPDDDGKYIYYEDEGSSSAGTTYTTTSSFTCSGTIPSSYNITSVKFVIRARRSGDSSSDSAISGTVGSSSLSSTNVTSSYANYEASATTSDLTRSGNTVTATLSTTSRLKVYKNNPGAVRITQAYIQVEAVGNYTVTTSATGPGTISCTQSVTPGASCTITITPTTASGGCIDKVLDGSTDVTSQLVKQSGYYTYTLSNVQADHTITATFKYYTVYIKQSGAWVQKPIYQKRNGSWVRLAEAPTGYANGDKIKTPVTDYLCFTANTAGSTIRMVTVYDESEPPAVSLKYSTDKSTWTTFTVDSTTVTLANVGDKVYFKGTSPNGFAESGASHQFRMTGKISASGDITTLLNEVGNVTDLTSYGTYTFAELFAGCSSLVSAPNLLPTVLTANCYAYLFQGTGIEVAPALLATSLATECYSGMFSGCTSLYSAPTLPATNLQNLCYANMFMGCTALLAAPALNATTLQTGCYGYMFKDCTALTTAPTLPATTLVSKCYQNIFENCTSLNSIKVSFTAWNPTNATTSWVNNISSSGTFTCPSALGNSSTITRGTSNCPTNWTVTNT